MKNKQSGFGIIEIVIFIALLGVVAALGYLTYEHHFSKGNDNNGDMVAVTQMPPLVRGVVGPKVSDINEYTKAPGLSEALNKVANNNPCAVTEGRYKQIVLGVTKDKTQALIGNSCGSTGVLRTFMVKQGSGWKSVGIWKDETKRANFSALTDTPSCEVVEQNNIQKAIAPVCYKLNGGTSSLMAGDLNNYSYVVR